MLNTIYSKFTIVVLTNCRFSFRIVCCHFKFIMTNPIRQNVNTFFGWVEFLLHRKIHKHTKEKKRKGNENNFNFVQQHKINKVSSYTTNYIYTVTYEKMYY